MGRERRGDTGGGLYRVAARPRALSPEDELKLMTETMARPTFSEMRPSIVVMVLLTVASIVVTNDPLIIGALYFSIFPVAIAWVTVPRRIRFKRWLKRLRAEGYDLDGAFAELDSLGVSAMFTNGAIGQRAARAHARLPEAPTALGEVTTRPAETAAAPAQAAGAPAQAASAPRADAPAVRVAPPPTTTAADDALLEPLERRLRR